MPKRDSAPTKERLFIDRCDELSRTVDKCAFERARIKVLSEGTKCATIGTLSEKTMHKVLKNYIEPDESFHEIEYLGSVADIMRDGQIYEIQTRAYDRLVPKLSRFLKTARVCIVCPLSAEKSVAWVNPETGELSSPRRSPKRETVYDAFKRLYQIRRFLKNEGISVKIMFSRTDEYKYLDGWDSTGKRGSSRMENIPRELLYEIELSSPEDYKHFVPSALGETFLASEFARAIGRTARFTFYPMKLLLELGVIERLKEKRGNAFIYKRL